MKRLSNASRQYLASVLRNVSNSTETLVENTISANEKIKTVRDVFNAEWYSALSDFDDEFSSLGSSPSSESVSEYTSKLQSAWVAALQVALFRSFRLGYGSRGRQDSTTIQLEKVLDEFPQFGDIVKKHSEYASQFARQYASGYTDQKGKMSFPKRINLYGQALKSAFNAGAVYGGTSGEKIFWRLGSCDHCVDCPALSAASPFTTDTIPTLPGNGDTICKTNCCCYLVFVNGPRSMEPEGGLDSWLEESLSLNESASNPTRSLQDAMLKLQYAKRQEDYGSLSDLISKVRSAASSGDLRSKSWYSPGSVITRADISQGEVNRIMEMGLDGPSIYRANISGSVKILDSVISKYGKVSRMKVVKPDNPEDRVPYAGSTSIVNFVGDGAVETFNVLKSVLLILNNNELFVEVGALDKSMQSVVGFSGVWIKGPPDEISSLSGLMVDHGSEFRVAEVMRL